MKSLKEEPIRGQYSGHVTCIDQSELSIYLEGEAGAEEERCVDRQQRQGPGQRVRRAGGSEQGPGGD